MSDINIETAIRLSAEDRASAVIRNLQRDVDALRRSIAAIGKIKLPNLTGATPGASSSPAMDFRAGAQALAAAKLTAATERQAARQREADAKARERDQRRFDSEAVRAIRARDAATAKSIKDQFTAQHRAERDERRAAAAAEREHGSDLRRRAAGIRYLAGLRARHDRDEQRAASQAERDREAALRRTMAGDRWRFELRNRMERQERREREGAERDVLRGGRDTWSRGRDALRDTFRPAGIAALAGTAATVAGTRRVLGAERDVDAAEIGTRAYGGLSFDAARELREKWAAPAAEAFGSDTAKLLTAWTDATKLGIPATGAKAFAEISTKTSEAWEVPFEQVTDIFGTINTLLTSQGQAFDPARLKSVANTLQHLAAKQSTTPEKMTSFLQRGAGAAQVLGMSQESGLAFGSASTSLGNQAGQSGRMFDYLASRVIELPRLVKGKGEEAEQARTMVRALGYGSAEAMDKQRRADPDQFLPDFMQRFARIKDQRKQDQAIRFFTGREWLGEFGRMVKGADTYREAVKLAKEAKGLDAIGAVWDLHKFKLGFVMKKFRAGWLNILGEFGKTLSPMARQAGDYFLEWSSKLRAGALQARFKATLDGLLEGFGFSDLPDALRRIFGKPSEGNAGAVETWKATAREFTAGIRDVFSTLGDVLRSFSGGSPEVLARWTGRFLALGAALVVASPFITVLSGLASGILALGAAATTALAAFKLAGLVGASGAAAGAAGAVAGAGGLAAILGAAVLPVTLVGVSAAVVAAIWGKEALKGAFLGVPSGSGAEPQTPEGDLGAELGAIAPRRRRGTDAPARVEKQSYGGYSGTSDRRLIQPIAFRERDERFGGYNGAFDNRLLHQASFQAGGNAIAGMLQRVSTMAFPGLGNAAGAGMAGIGSGGSGGSGSRSAGAGPTVPGWFNRGNGTQGGGIQGFGANPGAYKPFLDYIAQAEGTAGGKNNGYDVTLANGKLLPGGREQDLTKMSLDQIDAMQSGMLRHPGNRWNSSAAGRYQIVQKTLRGLRQKFGLRGDQLFDEKLQDQLGAELARARGANAGALGQEWASLKGGKGQRAAQLLGQVPREASTTPQDRPAGASGAGVTGGAADAVDVAKTFEGMDENRDNAKLKSFMGREIRGAQNAWCASFVNSSLQAVGLKGTGSGIANSYLNWGRSVDANEVQKGDVAVEHRGRGANAPGGHVGLATGRKQINRQTGELEIEVISGNNGNGVKTEWESARKLALRRSTDPKAAIKQPDANSASGDRDYGGSDWQDTQTPEAKAQNARKAEPFDLNGWAPKGGAVMSGPDPRVFGIAKAWNEALKLDKDRGVIAGRDGTGGFDAYAPKGFDRRSMIGTAPTDLMQKPTVEGMLSKMPAAPKPAPGQGSPGGGGRGSIEGMTTAGRGGTPATIIVNNTIHAGNQSPREMAVAMERHVKEAMNYRSHDLEPELT